MTRALIVGSGGQDGQILTTQLTAQNVAVVGLQRTRLLAPEGLALAWPKQTDVTKYDEVEALVRLVQPEQIYYLAAYHHSSEDLEQDETTLFERSYQVHVQGLVNTLEAMRVHSPESRLFYAASSHVFGYPQVPVQDESTPFEPRCAYGITKTAGIHACRFYREHRGVYAAVGILYNHESPLRAHKFVSQRIVQGALRVLRGLSDGESQKLVLGSLASATDWGYAPDYVDAMRRILGSPTPEDFVIATGVRHTVRDFAEAIFDELGLRWEDHVEEQPGLLRKVERTLTGDASKLRAKTGWQPSVTFREMAKILVRAAQAAQANPNPAA